MSVSLPLPYCNVYLLTHHVTPPHSVDLVVTVKPGRKSANKLSTEWTAHPDTNQELKRKLQYSSMDHILGSSFVELPLEDETIASYNKRFKSDVIAIDVPYENVSSHIEVNFRLGLNIVN